MSVALQLLFFFSDFPEYMLMLTFSRSFYKNNFKKSVGVLVGIALNLQINLGDI